MHIEQVMVTPEYAMKLLQDNNNSGFINRPLASDRVKLYAEAMKKGEWVLNNDNICIDPEGAIINGQHRLHSAILAKKSFPAYICYGMPRETFSKIDGQGRRTPADILAILGVKKSRNAISAVLFALAAYLSNNIFYYTGGRRYFEICDLFPLFEKYESDIMDSLHLYREQNIKRLPISLYGAFYVLFSSIDKDSAIIFFEGLNTGASLEKGSPILALRNQLEKVCLLENYRRIPASASLTIQSWNCLLQHQKRLLLRVTDELPPVYGLDKRAFLAGLTLPFEIYEGKEK